MHVLLRCNINAGVHARSDGADVSLRDVTIAQLGNGASKCEWRHAPEARGGFWEFWRKLIELRPASGEDGWFLLGRGGLGRVPHEMVVGGCRGKSQNRNNVYLSPYVEEPLNSKVMKSFVPEQRSRKCFFVFPDFYVPCIYIYIYIYIWTSHVHFAYSCMGMVQSQNRWIYAFSKNISVKWNSNSFVRFELGLSFLLTITIMPAACYSFWRGRQFFLPKNYVFKIRSNYVHRQIITFCWKQNKTIFVCFLYHGI